MTIPVLAKQTRLTSLLAAMLALLLAACATPRPVALPEPVEPAELPFDPSGDWEYEEQGRSTVLTLDIHGNGRYAWKDGRIITTRIDGQTWHGRWVQARNDREGGFELTLTDDYREAEGRWWYTRIGDDAEPTKKGGRFRLIRLP